MELDSKRGRDDQWVGVHLVNKLEWEGHIKVQYIRSNQVVPQWRGLRPQLMRFAE